MREFIYNVGNLIRLHRGYLGEAALYGFGHISSRVTVGYGEYVKVVYLGYTRVDIFRAADEHFLKFFSVKQSSTHLNNNPYLVFLLCSIFLHYSTNE